MLHKSNNSESEYGKRLRRILRSCGLKNIMNGPTRITAHSKSLIDLVITSQPSKLQTSDSIDLGISDHHLIFAVFKVARSNAKPKVISTRNYKLLDKRLLRSDFDQAPWHITELFDDIGDSVDTWQYLYNEILHHHLPPRDVKIRDKSLPWINMDWRWCLDILHRRSYCTPCSFLGKIKLRSNMAKHHHQISILPRWKEIWMGKEEKLEKKRGKVGWN